ncbi:MAG: BamA/TamA family outer membrane protein [Bacteroidales bacterium]|nr:BamA/TamA family outer membrane protein [Candidatus Scybalocola fimicaballi]
MKKAYFLIFALYIVLFSACSPVKYVADGDYLLDDVRMDIKNTQLKNNDAESYVRQQPNLKIFGLFRAHLRLYSLSRKDSIKSNGRVRHLGRALRKMGEPPVIYNSMMRIQSERQIEKYYRAKGFMNAKASSDVEYKKKRAVVTYHVDEGVPFVINNIDYDYRGDTAIKKIVETDRFYESKLKNGMLFDSDELDAERNNMSSLLRRRGYFYFTKDYISYTADTTVGDHKVDITLELKPFSKTQSDGSRVDVPHAQYKIADISVVTLDKPIVSQTELLQYDSVRSEEGILIKYMYKPFLRSSVIEDNIIFGAGDMYNSYRSDFTLSKFNSLGIVRAAYVNFVDKHNDENEVDCQITLSPTKTKSVSANVEATITSLHDFGFGGTLGWSHHNIFRGSERLSFKLSYSQEAVSGIILTSDSTNKIRDYGASVTLTIPRVMFPFLSRDFKRRINASTELDASFNIQRMGYKRDQLSFGWKYMWQRRRFYNYTIDFLDYNLVRMAEADSFRARYFNDHSNPILLYNYTDHQILCTGFTYTFDNMLSQRVLDKKLFKASFETGGNMFRLFRNVFNYDRDSIGGQDLIFGVPYSQYVKTELEYAFNQYINEKCRMAYHAKAGVAVPYGNSKGVPFEKRFYGGGASGVRGWAVRTLGPGKYSNEDYLAQTGDINLLLNLEYRIKLFWKLELATFLDGGNVWTIDDYPDQQGGVFDIKEFYKQIALAGGAGLRLDFSYFLIRFDLGMKIHDPSRIDDGSEWRINHHRCDESKCPVRMNWKDDFAFHFAVGYPF